MSNWTGRRMHEHYLKGGYDNVEIRDKVNILADRPPGTPPYDLELAAAYALHQAGLQAEDLVVDVGSGRIPYFLGLLKLQGHDISRLVGVEPNIPDDDSRPWLRRAPNGQEPTGMRLPRQRASEQIKPDLPLEAFEGITMVRGYAETLPIAEAQASVITAFRSLYHMGPRDLSRFYANLQISLQPNGIFAASTRGQQYKQNMRITERQICGPLSDMMGSIVSGPEPLNAGWTSEKAREWFMDRFRYVWELRNRANIIIPGRFALQLVMNAHLTLTDMYEDKYGNHPTHSQHEAALYEVLGSQISELHNGQPMTDIFDESLFIASDVEQNIPLVGSGQDGRYVFQRLK